MLRRVGDENRSGHVTPPGFSGLWDQSTAERASKRRGCPRTTKASGEPPVAIGIPFVVAPSSGDLRKIIRPRGRDGIGAGADQRRGEVRIESVGAPDAALDLSTGDLDCGPGHL